MHKILIIDDSPEIVILYEKMIDNYLQNVDYINTVIYTLNELKDFLNNEDNFKEKYSLIISEIELHGENITDYLEILKTYQPRTPLYIVSNKMNLNSIKNIFKIGAMDWIEKPIVPEEFSIMLAESIFKGETFESKYRKLRNELIKFDKNENLEFFMLEDKISNLIFDNPNRYEGHFLLGYLYWKKLNNINLLKKHYNAALALAENSIKDKELENIIVKILEAQNNEK
ncbi:Response regulator receiver domain-containing protein [Marinitoga hydrogenitolerans DSM 16785]|uniref:Response regulator receiver domain-containing protein n=1 Tax=Marinitoga hydrogenitolerans (strain DSM 16785 / JCM 12826 / AT1271) TaxID=1122195 RepID=A0A1M4X6X7_MARH1|nr:response regulator [Marinitoga hydrogenitolerans]SHE89241.1 Response regulator receiver domain-containing protein [Marinitoga hydrogenitolerans DSM 16785]